MGEIIKGFLGMICIILLLMTGVSVLTTMIEITNAKSYKSNVVAILENSDYDVAAIGECISEASELGYDLTVQCYSQNIFTGERSVGDWDTIGSAGVEIYMADVRLEYEHTMPLFQVRTEHVFQGYAR